MKEGSILYANAGAYNIMTRNPLSEDKKTFVGYIAHNAANSDEVDIVVVWRATITKDEWIQVSSTSCISPLACNVCLCRIEL